MALYVVQGPPAAGKTTWVQATARHGDIVVDLDAIASALTVHGDRHHHEQHVLRCAQRARGVVIDEALKRCTQVDVYVIHTLPPAKALARYAEHGAQVITIDPGQDVIMQRIGEQRHHTARAVAARWYAQSPPTTGITHRDDDQGSLINSRSW